MRVINRPNPHDERGAVLVVVALVMTALFGMTVLVVDVGGLVSLRRRMVTAADSAALSAAQSCAIEESGADFQADVVAKANVPDTTRTSIEAEGCGTDGDGSVSLKYTAPQELYFAPILGTPRSASVESEATAKWGPAAAATPAPVVINLNSSSPSECLALADGQVCALWHDYTSQDLTATDHFAFANLDRWGVSWMSSCRSADRDLGGWITGADKVDVELESGGPTYVCATSGRSRSTTVYNALRSRIGDTLHMPVSYVPGLVPIPRREKFRIAGFVPLEVVDAIRGDDPRAIGTPGASGNCEEDIFPRRGDRIFLDALDGPGCPDGRTPQTISDLELSRGGTTYDEGRDYSYDPITHVVTWLRSGRRRRIELEFDWSIAGTAGACGNRAAGSSNICLVVRFNRPQIGGRLGAPALDFGLRAIGLQE